MATFTGTAAGEAIEPIGVSPTVTSDPPGSVPGPGSDTLNGGGGDDSLDGGGGNDTLEGGPGDNSVNGGDGDDLIIWREGDGNEVTKGGSGTDTLRLIMSDTADVVVLATLTNNPSAPLIVRNNPGGSLSR